MEEEEHRAEESPSWQVQGTDGTLRRLAERGPIKHDGGSLIEKVVWGQQKWKHPLCAAPLGLKSKGRGERRARPRQS